MSSTPSTRGRGPALAAWVGAAVVLAVAVRVLYDWPSLNPDAVQALVWGRDLAHLRVPDYDDGATPHPLANLIGAVLSPLGPEGAWEAMRALAAVYFAGMVLTVFAVGRLLGGTLVGLAAAGVFVLTLAWAQLGVNDVGALALLVAAVWALSTGRVLGAGVALLAAGLLRPEDWLVCAAFATWLAATRPPRWKLAAGLAVAAPLIWALGDLIVTGHPTYSLTHTQDLAVAFERERDLADVPSIFADSIRELTRWPVILAGLLGFGLLWRDRVVAAIPVAALGVLAAGTFAAHGVAHLSLLGRYLVPVTVVLVLAAAYAAGAWRRRPDALHLVAGALAVALLAVSVAERVSANRDFADETSRQVELLADLRDLTPLLSCGPVHVQDLRGVVAPTVAQALGEQVHELRRFDGGPGSYLSPATPEAAALVASAGAAPRVPAPPGRVVGAAGPWRVSRLGC